jgi:hypothetical protein
VPFSSDACSGLESGSTPDRTVISHDDIKVTPPKGGPGSSRRATTSSKRRMPPSRRRTPPSNRASAESGRLQLHEHEPHPPFRACGDRGRQPSSADLRAHDRNLTRGCDRPVRRRERGRVERYKACSRGAGPSTVSLLSANSRHALITAEDQKTSTNIQAQASNHANLRRRATRRKRQRGVPNLSRTSAVPPSRGRAGTSRRPREVLDRRTTVANPAVQRGEGASSATANDQRRDLVASLLSG